MILVRVSEIQTVGFLAPLPVPPRVGSSHPPRPECLTGRVVSDPGLTLSEPPGAGAVAKSLLTLELMLVRLWGRVV